MTEKKIVSLKYPGGRDIFYHPKTLEEFQKLMEQMAKFNEIGDSNGVYSTAMQLIPRVVETEEGKSIKDILMEWLIEQGDHGEISVIDVVEVIDKVYPGFLIKYNRRGLEDD